MDTAATGRAANLANFGDSHIKEAQGLQVLLRAIKENGRLQFHKSFEGARADCCVYKPGIPALGIQIKTTGTDWVQRRTGNKYYRFGSTDGYAGLLMVFVALHVEPHRIWLADGAEVVSKDVHIPVTRVRRGVRSDRVREVELATLANTIYEIHEAAMSSSSNYVLRSPTEHERPTARNALAEYAAFKRIQRSLRVLFVNPPAEHTDDEPISESVGLIFRCNFLNSSVLGSLLREPIVHATRKSDVVSMSRG